MPSRTRADLAADFDVVLARIPDRLFLWGPLVLTGLGLVLLALSAPWLALLVGLALPWGVAYARVGYRRDVASALATSAPAIEPAWQARYAQIEQTAGLLAARNGQAAPRLLVDPAPASINAVAIRGEGQDFLSLGAGLLDAGLSSVLAFDDLVAASAHEIAHLRPAMRDEPRRGALLSTVTVPLERSYPAQAHVRRGWIAEAPVAPAPAERCPSHLGAGYPGCKHPVFHDQHEEISPVVKPIRSDFAKMTSVMSKSDQRLSQQLQP
jgi:hypothetical protein